MKTTSKITRHTDRKLNAIVALARAGNQIKLDWAGKLGVGPGKLIKDKDKNKYESKIEDNLKKGADPKNEDYLKK